ncbi:hypothetical protein HNY73_009849 [Argiope bruennichi]|uniref:Uncharacterized protein n=1 Tax=Argiope bruennichi TaxID=94029 RepID=A0A8T0FAP8_ARGBR|nr:hypothetical protein HNY73_009849 [Argiope bruennichi]
MSFLYHEVERKEQRVLAETSFGIAFLDQPKICSSLPKIHDENLLTELASRGIKLTDVGKDTPPIKDLLGADVLGSILTGKNRDVSARGYACYVFLRYDKEAGVKVSFTLAKARVVPVQRPTIPRQKVSEAADLTIIQSFYLRTRSAGLFLIHSFAGSSPYQKTDVHAYNTLHHAGVRTILSHLHNDFRLSCVRGVLEKFYKHG